ncbi:MAG: DUF1800 family protein [Gammaproteobacteria bacterium]|nr:DUF1800 family protein [Gammaproteobacteria bacterium]
MTASRITVVLALCGLLAAGCGGGGGDGDSTVPVNNTAPPAASTPPPDPDPDPDDSGSNTGGTPPAYKNLFTPVSDATWDETAVRKVLHTFAYGGQTSDAQVQAWAGMAPEFAIAQMLTFDEHNTRLSAPVIGDTDGLASRGGTLRELAAFWASNDPANGVVPERRESYAISNFSGTLSLVWQRAALSRGLNPFRHKIGFWETNYHMAVNRRAVPNNAMLRYYDDIMAAHEAGLPYQQVMAVAAKSAAAALQYGHRTNRYRNGECDCNEDFAREYHQLYFGILGASDPDEHENVTIKETAKAFTDMVVYFDQQTGFTDAVDFGNFYHPDGPLQILGESITGSTAAERIDQMVEVSIAHPESLANLPVMIISDLADDNLDVTRRVAIRRAWNSMSNKNLLDFLRGYAISTIFHDASRIKHLNSIDRHLLLSNLTALNNREQYLNIYYPRHAVEDVQVFFPTHDVFGTQKGMEAASSDLVFRTNHGEVTGSAWRYRSPYGENYGVAWEKDWAAAAPRAANGTFNVKQVAEWLWQRYLADGLKNFRYLERAHVYALLGSNYDLAYLLDPDNPERSITSVDVLSEPAILDLVADLSSRTLLLDSVNSDERYAANRRIGMAINFIVGTPYIFAQEGR